MDDQKPAKKTDPEWIGAWTLSEWIVDMIEKRRFNDSSFIAAVEVYGLKKVQQIWEAHKSKKRQGQSDSESK